MKRNTFKNSMISMLSVCILLLLSSQAVYAVKPVKEAPVPATPTTVIHSVVVNITSSTIVVTGAELDAITEVTLAGLTVTFNSTDESTGVINFTDINNAVTAVLTAGNYSLVVGDTVFSIYLSSADAAAITPAPVVDYTACPCYADWEQFGTNYGYIGFEGATATCSTSADQVLVSLINDEPSPYTEYWFLQTNATEGTCSTPYFPGMTGNEYMLEEGLDQTEYNACTSYLQTTYCN